MAIAEQLIQLSQQNNGYSCKLSNFPKEILFDLKIGEISVVLNWQNNVVNILVNKEKLNEKNQIASGFIQAMILLSGQQKSEKMTEISYREAENMLRDRNSVPSFESHVFPDCEYFFQQLRDTFQVSLKLFRTLDHFYPELDQFTQKDFFTQLALLHRVREKLCQDFGRENNKFPRLSQWFAETGTLILLVNVEMPITSLEANLCRQFFQQIEGIREIKMVASE